MASARKLQAEIDRVLKKVDEGAEDFEATLEKLHSTSSQKQKEKYEEELKRSIKKLQRQRDQIKTWQQSSQIKDKRPLDEARKRIEKHMEQFKNCEREMKTKAYSKEGLEQAARNKSASKEKKTILWMQECIKTLEEQITEFETELAELEEKDDMEQDDFERLAILDCLLARHKVHQKNLNTFIEHIRNDRIQAEEVEGTLKEHMEEYLRLCQDEEYYEDETIYSVLKVKPEGKNPLIADASKRYTIDDDSTGLDGLPISGKVPSQVEAESKKKIGAKAAGGSSNTKPIDRSGSSTSSSGTNKKKESSTTKGPATTAITERTIKPPAKDNTSKTRGPSVLPEWSKTPATTKDSAAQTEPVARGGATFAPGTVYNPPSVHGSNTNRAAQIRRPTAPTGSASERSAATQGRVFAADATTESPTSPGTLADLASATMRMHGIPVPPGASRRPAPMSHAPGLGIHGALPSRRPITQRDARPMWYSEELGLLNTSKENAPAPFDTERPTQYNPGTPVEVPSYFPQEPLPIFSDPAVFEKFETDTLFFVFYYQQGSYQQHLAAKELKKQYWRYHKKYLTWFQRHEEPKEITNEFEQGTYVYFDYETGWCQRKKTEFTFHYRFLEE